MKSAVVVLTLLCCLCGAFAGEILFEENFTSPGALKKWKGAGIARWLEKQGPGMSNAVMFHNPQTADRMISLPLDGAGINGLIKLEAVIKGEGLEPARTNYWGPKLMLSFCDRQGKMFYLEPLRQFGTYGWKNVCKIIQLPEGCEKLTLTTGIQKGAGTYYVTNIRISRYTGEEEAVANRCVNKAAAAIPRGNGSGAKYRGVMSGNSLTEADFAVLKDWKVNLMRYQMNFKRGSVDISTQEKYLAWIDAEIRKLDRILPLAGKYGITIVIDLHIGPGTKINQVASNVLVGGSLSLGTLVKAWEKIASHYQGNPDIYGYDLLNEPMVEGYVKNTSDPWQFIAETLVKAIRRIDPATPIIIEPNFDTFKPVDAANIIYSPHIYAPHAFTHQLVITPIRWSYPGIIDGVYWDKDQLRVSMKAAIDFQRKYNVPIFVGEFSAPVWAKGADKYLADCIELFEEYGWDWTYHAFREWNAWSLEHEGTSRETVRPSADNPRKQVMLKAFRKNSP